MSLTQVRPQIDGSQLQDWVDDIPFTIVQEALLTRFNELLSKKLSLVVVDVEKTEVSPGYFPTNGEVTPKASSNKVWDLYISSFEEPLKQQNTCRCCYSFIKLVGGLIALERTENNEMIRHTLWDIQVPSRAYKEAFSKMNDYVLSRPIKGAFIVDKARSLGAKSLGGYNHFYLKDIRGVYTSGPKTYLVDKAKIGKLNHLTNTAVSTLTRACLELSKDAITSTLDGIGRNKLPRSAQLKPAVEKFYLTHSVYNALEGRDREDFIWDTVMSCAPSKRESLNFLQSFVGTFVQNLTNGMSWERALDALKASENTYRVVTSTSSVSEIQRLQQALIEGNYMPSLSRKIAELKDIPADYLRFAFPEKQYDIFSAAIQEVSKPIDVKSLQRVQDIHITDLQKSNFFREAKLVEILAEPKLSNSLIALCCPTSSEGTPITRWQNNMTWCFTGNRAFSSIRERAEKAGAKVTGDRGTLIWEGTDDLDLHLAGPSGFHVYYGNKEIRGAHLDVDQNACDISDDPVENIFINLSELKRNGTYIFKVQNFRHRDGNQGFNMEVVLDGVSYYYNYPNSIRNGENISIMSFSVEKGKLVKDSISHKITPETNAKEIKAFTKWGIEFSKWQPVIAICDSPNYWEAKVGNHILCLLIQGAHYGDSTPPKSLFNEQITDKLAHEYRKSISRICDSVSVDTKTLSQQAAGFGFSTSEDSSFYLRLDQHKVYHVNCGPKP